MREPDGGWQLTLRFVWRLTASSLRHDIFSLGAVIAFYAFFSLFPLLLLIIYAASVLLPNSNVEQVLLTMVRPYFPTLSAAKDVIADSITNLAQQGGKIGLVSGLTLLWSATSGFMAVQQTMDVIWETPHQRSFVVRRLIAFAMLVVLLLLTLVSAAVMAMYTAVRPAALAHVGVLHWLNLAHGVSRVLFPLSLFAGCVVFYRYLPSRASPWPYLVAGALVATAVLDGAREVFIWYAGHLGTYQMIYGTLTAVMLLALWMYVASIILLFGAEVATTLEALLDSAS
ncbi:MAG: YihY/virulence factor BrkB family protein [Alicyclobacillaceae bacterium]|nr:YihY/virulence factor BrkB family protein [Alicyclobacillaceae bacterium]